ncbi:hypothetical protein I4U23_010930 [Adineta vaga]|nr:hypothetical protein I4U23_010930 [Adineta vaga]
MKNYLNSLDVQYAFCAEDCTGVIRRIKYDEHTDSFIGFCTPLSDGVPITSRFRTNSLAELNMWMETNEKAPLLSAHCIQAIPPANQTTVPLSFILSAYGTSSKYTALDILKRWIFIYKKSIERIVRIIGFSTDGDSKYFCAVRLMSGFYASMANLNPHIDTSAFSIRTDNWSWYFLRPEQILVLMQDATHLVTKLRNRLLSTTAELRIGNTDITLEHLQQILDDSEITKLDHGLTQTDLNPADRQNFRSCFRITNSDVLNLLGRDEDADGTRMYLQLIKFIITYIEPTTSINPLRPGLLFKK